MNTKFIEACDQTNFNWGKFVVSRFDEEEWQRQPSEPVAASYKSPLLGRLGWGREHILVFDLQTCEGAAFRPGGSAPADLAKHRIWVCPMFEPFLSWLYQQDLTDLSKLPGFVNLGDVPTAMQGYRRPGPSRREESK